MIRKLKKEKSFFIRFDVFENRKSNFELHQKY